MENKESWNAFRETGKVEDYLKFKNVQKDILDEMVEEKSHARICGSNRDDIESCT
ncbi:MAG: hypothetical protein ACRC7V_07090 [Lachnospiraceae bacterium]